MRYHFNLHEGAEVILDQEGSEFATLTSARAEACATLLEIVSHDIRSRRPALDWCIEIATSEGRVIDSIGLHFFSSEYLRPAIN
jgi:hypothetical protein